MSGMPVGKRRHTEVQFDLVAVRKLRRLARRVVAGLDAIEKHLVKMERADKPRACSPAEIEATTEVYRAAADFVNERL